MYKKIVLLSLLMLLFLGMGGGVVNAASGREPVVGPFTFITEGEVWGYNLAMSYPGDNAYVLEDAAKKLETVMTDWPWDKMATLLVENEPEEALRILGPRADQVILNPYSFEANESVDTSNRIWYNVNHPAVNRVRQLRSDYTKRLLALIDLNGEPTRFDNRRLTFPEFQWLAFAAMGANYQGIVLRGLSLNVEWTDKLKELRTAVFNYAEDLGKARPVNWVQSQDEQPLTATASDKFLFIYLLNPCYMVPCSSCGRINIPVKPAEQKGSIEILPPHDIDLGNCVALDGSTTEVSFQANRLRVDYRFSGGGQMLIFDIKKTASGNPPPCVPRTYPPIHLH